ncbi:MAG: class IV adenylate cyclase [Thermoflavifilum sp.]|nr:class IV adenylate cyclase [Thermoflavifilum sp.]
MPVNMEFKARVADLGPSRKWLRDQQARFVGMDEQVDVYFHVPKGRLKLRMGQIERALIYYKRAEQDAIRRSDVWLYPVQDAEALKQLLQASLGILGEVSKKREIYFIDATKFHLDEVKGLGYFIEVEVIDASPAAHVDRLEALAAHYQQALHIRPDQLIRASYLDMLLAANGK